MWRFGFGDAPPPRSSSKPSAGSAADASLEEKRSRTSARQAAITFLRRDGRGAKTPDVLDLEVGVATTVAPGALGALRDDG
jgi:hypothetical protein